MRTFPLPPATVTVLAGDISSRDVDAVVNAANSALWMGSGVAGAIKSRGGPAIEREAMAQGPIAPGEAVITAGGHLLARHVIHAAAMGEDLRTDADLIVRATRSALALAEAHGLRSVAFPALGTGVGGFPVSECARLMLGALRDGLTPASSVTSIEFVLFGAAAYDAFAEAVTSVPGLRS